MRLAAALALGGSALALLGSPAAAQLASPVQPSGIQVTNASPIASPLTPAGGKCKGIDLSAPFVAGLPACYAGFSAASYATLPGMTITPGTLTGGASTTALTAAGTLQHFSSGQIRLTDAGITTDGPSENDATHSQDLANGAIFFPFNQTIAAADITAPDGTSTAFKLTTTGVFSALSRNTMIPISGSHSIVSSAFCNLGTAGACTLNPTDGDGLATAVITIAGGKCVLKYPPSGFKFTNVFAAPPVTLGGGWCRGSVNYTTQSSTTGINDRVWGGDSTLNGATNGQFFYLWGLQTQPVLSNYLPTTTAAAIFSGDVLRTTCPNACPGDHAVVYYGAQNAYIAPSGTIDLVALSQTLGGPAISQLLVQAAKPLPAFAKAMGLTSITLDDQGFSCAVNVDCAGTLAPGKHWYFQDWSGWGAITPSAVTFNGDGSMSVANEAGQNFNGTLGTAACVHVSGSCPSSNAAFKGLALTGAYMIEWRAKSRGTDFDDTTGFPALWDDPIENMAVLPGNTWPASSPPHCHHGEHDIEIFARSGGRTGTFNTPAGSFQTSDIDWDGLLAVCGTIVFANQFNIVGADDTVFSAYHDFAFAHIPATVSTTGGDYWFYDGVLKFQTSWTQINDSVQPPIADPYKFAVADFQHQVPLIGSGSTNPVTVLRATIYQAPGAAAANLVH